MPAPYTCFFVAGHSVGVCGMSHQVTECPLNEGQSDEWNTTFKVKVVFRNYLIQGPICIGDSTFTFTLSVGHNRDSDDFPDTRHCPHVVYVGKDDTWGQNSILYLQH